VFEACDSSANTDRKPVRETCCSVIHGKLQLKHASAAKKNDMNKSKNIKNVARCRDRSAKA